MEGWGLAGSSRRVSPTEIAAALADDPLRFSTSALLRPLVQDTLFPTAAYVGGPAELGYFAQLGPLYDLFELPQPLVVLRARFRYVEAKTRALLDKLALRPGDLERSERALLRRLADAAAATQQAPPPATLGAELEAALGPALQRLRAAVTAVDPSLARPAERTGGRIQALLESLVQKYARALARKDATNQARLQRLRTRLYPEGMPQERFYAWPSLAARVGVQRFARQVREALVPFSPEVRELEEAGR